MMEPSESAEEAIKKMKIDLSKITKEIQQMEIVKETLYKDFQKSQHKSRCKRQHIKSQNELIAMTVDQIALNEALRNEMCGQDSNIAELDKARGELLQMKQSLQDVQMKWEIELKQLISHSKQLEREFYSLKLQINDLRSRSNAISKMLSERGVRLDESDLLPFVEEFDQSTWLMKDFTRDDAERLLKGRQTGCFLIRPSSLAPHALSIVAQNTVFHCLIYYVDGKYGFYPEHTVHPDLKSLVAYYQNHSLEYHNSELRTCLTEPFRVKIDSQNQKQNQAQLEYSQLLPSDIEKMTK